MQHPFSQTRHSPNWSWPMVVMEPRLMSKCWTFFPTLHASILQSTPSHPMALLVPSLMVVPPSAEAVAQLRISALDMTQCRTVGKSWRSPLGSQKEQGEKKTNCISPSMKMTKFRVRQKKQNNETVIVKKCMFKKES